MDSNNAHVFLRQDKTGVVVLGERWSFTQTAHAPDCGTSQSLFFLKPITRTTLWREADLEAQQQSGPLHASVVAKCKLLSLFRGEATYYMRCAVVENRFLRLHVAEEMVCVQIVRFFKISKVVRQHQNADLKMRPFLSSRVC